MFATKTEENFSISLLLPDSNPYASHTLTFITDAKKNYSTNSLKIDNFPFVHFVVCGMSQCKHYNLNKRIYCI